MGKVTVVIAILFAFLASGNALATAEKSSEKTYKMKWLLAHDPVDLFVEAANYFAVEVGKRTNGKVDVTILTTKTLNPKDYNVKHVFHKKFKVWNPDQVIKAIMSGEIEMTQTYTTSLGRYHNQLWVLDVPYLFRDHDHATKVLDGAIGKRLMAGLEKHNMKGLAFTYSGGFRILPTTGREIRKMEDFKGIKVGTSSSPVAQAVFDKLGGIAIPMPLVKGREMTRKGMLEGIETTYPRLYSMNQHEVSKVMNDTKHSLFLTSIVVNQDFFNSLPAKYQKVVREVAREAAALERKISIDDGIATKKRAKKDGFKVVELSKNEQQRIKNAIKPVLKRFDKAFDSALMAEIEAVN